MQAIPFASASYAPPEGFLDDRFGSLHLGTSSPKFDGDFQDPQSLNLGVNAAGVRTTIRFRTIDGTSLALTFRRTEPQGTPFSTVCPENDADSNFARGVMMSFRIALALICGCFVAATEVDGQVTAPKTHRGHHRRPVVTAESVTPASGNGIS